MGAGVWVVIVGDTVRWERLTQEDEWMILCLEIAQACPFLPTSTSNTLFGGLKIFLKFILIF